MLGFALSGMVIVSEQLSYLMSKREFISNANLYISFKYVAMRKLINARNVV
jgi:hypothetical protein